MRKATRLPIVFRRWREESCFCHLSVANGSLMAFETQCPLVVRLDYCQPSELSVLGGAAQVDKMLAGPSRKPRQRQGQSAAATAVARRPTPGARHPVPERP